MQTNTFHSDYTYLFGLGLLVLGAAWIVACVGYMAHYFPEHGGGAVVMFSLAALIGVFSVHLGRTMLKADHKRSR